LDAHKASGFPGKRRLPEIDRSDANKLTPGSNLRWESSRMMLPEHVAALKKHKLDKQRSGRPVLAEDKLKEMERVIRKAIAEKLPIDLFYFKDGLIKHRIGYPDRLDLRSRRLAMHDPYGLKWKCAFLAIMDVEIGVNGETH
jgi:hypothetical protein